ncbi:MAG TPA: GNAT family N-acetyltransferase [Candidatus Dormibacteraeota bacterium]|nr:GNAT family N-acetyltransferase [Candidatus Dormibacteraeota bacterium]
MIAAAMGRDGDLVASRLERECLCFAAFSEGALLGYGWLSRGPEWIGELQLEIKPREWEAYIWNCVTLPQHRRRGVFRSLVAGMSTAARRLGARRVWIGSVDIPAEVALPSLGFVPSLHFDVLCVAGVHAMRVRRAADRRFAADASSVVGVSPGLVLRGSHPRRH